MRGKWLKLYNKIFWEELLMNKTDLIDSMAKKSELTKKDSEKALNALIESMEEALGKGEKIQLVGFGSFEVKQRAARKGRNPQTMEEIDIPESKAPVFKAGKELKEMLNK
jgi:DNA-binding protein HU-beta